MRFASQRLFNFIFHPSWQLYEVALLGIDCTTFVALLISFCHCKSVYSSLISSGGLKDGNGGEKIMREKTQLLSVLPCFMFSH